MTRCKRARLCFLTFLAGIAAACFMVMTSRLLCAEQEAETAHAQVAPATPPDHSRLSAAKSPYLLEHARDLVDWYPWGAEAFEQAKKENKLIFLSSGYSSCHWCHVMQEEDFENPQVARLMNHFFISILVDREELPSVDNQYLAVCEMLTGSGGWPLNLIMTPEGKPFFASTYIPRESEDGRPGILQLLPEIERKWQDHPGELSKGADRVERELLKSLDRNTPGSPVGAPALAEAYQELAARFDNRNAGFGGVPKFPPALEILFLLRYWKRTGNANALKMVERTLDAMRSGGIFDQLGFGFYRYTIDAGWRTPHFEKMLYDQALLALAYTEAYQATGGQQYEATARGIFTYVLRELTSPQGPFYTAEDADSNGTEGGYYLWTEDQIRQVLGPESGLAIKAFGIRAKGNFPGGSRGENVLVQSAIASQLSAKFDLSPKAFEASEEKARQKLLAARLKRAHPRVDEKVLTGWNGLMIAALAQGAQAFGDDKYMLAAERAADFLLAHARSGDGRLYHVYEDQEAAVPGNLNDYSFCVWGLIELYEASFQARYLRAALELNRQLVQHFWDVQNGGFYFTADDDHNNVIREKNIDDVELPSGNGVEALNLLRLADMTGDTGLASRAMQVERAFAGNISGGPADHMSALLAASYALNGAYEVVIAGNAGAADTLAMLRAASAPFLPNKIVLLRPTNVSAPGILQLADFTRNDSSIDGKATAYVCLKYRCDLPTTDPRKMLQLLQNVLPPNGEPR